MVASQVEITNIDPESLARQVRERLSTARVGGVPVVCIGAGISGCAAALFLLRRGVPVVVLEQGAAGVGVHLKLRDQVTAAGGIILYGVASTADIAITLEPPQLVVLSPGVRLDGPLVTHFAEMGPLIIQELELGVALAALPTIIVTGSNGKSTTATLIHQLLTAVSCPSLLVGNIGTPVVSQLDDYIDEAFYLTRVHPLPSCVTPRFLVVEASSYQLDGTLALKPRVGVFLNLVENHLERHGSMEGYFNAKRKPFLRQDRDDWLVLGSSDSWAERLAAQVKGRVVRVGWSSLKGGYGITLDKSHLMVEWNGVGGAEIPIDGLTLPGEHNLVNLGCAVAAVLAVLEPSEGEFATLVGRLSQAVPHLRGLPHRLQHVGKFGGVDWINDSKATTVAALSVALEAVLQQPSPAIFLLVGGVPKGGSNWEPVVGRLRDSSSAIKGVITFGQAATQLAEIFRASGVKVILGDRLAVALQQAKEVAVAGDTVLVSPGCASFDEFASFEERGRFICEWLMAHKGSSGGDGCQGGDSISWWRW